MKKNFGLSLEGEATNNIGNSSQNLLKGHLASAIYLLELYRIQKLKIDMNEAINSSMVMASSVDVLTEYAVVREQLNNVEFK